MTKLFTAIFVGVVLAGSAFGAQNQSLPADATAQHHHHMWHCTAYDSHHHGFSAKDEHRSHAYSAAVRRCEAATGEHCHHVDCHLEHR